MKLPEFRSAADQTSASRSTSMSSAFMTPQLRPMTEKHQAYTHNTNIRPYNPQLEAKAAMAKYQVADTVIAGLGSMAEMYGRIDLASQEMAYERAAAEYTQAMGEFSANEVLTGGEIDPVTGQQRHFGAEDRYNEQKERLTDEILERNKFSNPKLVHQFGLKVNAADYTYGQSITTSGNKHLIEKAKSDGLIAIDSAKSPEAKKVIVDSMVEQSLLTDIKAYELKKDIDKEATQNAYSNMIKSDLVGVDSSKVMQAVRTNDFINENGIDTSNRLYKQAVERMGLLISDNMVQAAVQSGSKETAKKMMLDYSQRPNEELGVSTLEERDDLLDVVNREMKQAIALMEASEVVSAKESNQTRFNTRMSQPKGDDASNQMTLPVNKATQNTYYEETYGQTPPIDVMSDPDVFRHEHKNMIVEGRIIPHMTDSWSKAMNSGDAGLTRQASTQIGTIVSNPRTPVSVSKQMRKDVGSDNVDLAIAIHEGKITGDALDDVLKYNRSTNKEAVDASYQADMKEFDLLGFMMDKYDDTDTAVTEENVKGAPLRAIEQILQRKYKSQKLGRNLESYAEAAWTEYAETWSPEIRTSESSWYSIGDLGRDVTYEIVPDSLYANTGSTNGLPTEQAQAMIVDTLTVGNRADVLERVENRESTIVNRKMPNSDVYAMYEVRKVDGVEDYELIINPVTRLPLMASRSERFELEKAQQDFDQSAIRGISAAEAIRGESSETAVQQANRQALGDAFMKQYSTMLKGKEAIEGFAEHATTEFYGSMVDGLANLFVRRGDSLTEDDLKTFLQTGSFNNVSLDKEGNDMVWSYIVNYYQDEMNKQNAQRPTYSEPQMKSNIADIKASLISKGLVEPGTQ